MLIQKIKNNFTDKGFILCLLLSLVILFVFFGNLFVNPNTTFFGSTGDAIQVYYNSIFHVKFDNQILTSGSMFYPYAESSFFTGCMPLLTTLIKFIGLENFTVAIINLFMLLSMPLSALFLYLIFKEYKVIWWFAAMSAVTIAYLSPQIYRLTAHFNLSYCFAIPATIWMMVKYRQSPSYKKSFIIALYGFFLASMHMYLFMFSLIIITFYWIASFFENTFKSNFKRFCLNYGIQIILPFLLLQMLIYIVNEGGARTNAPWGFFEYYSNLYGVFYSKNELYQPIYNFLKLNPNVNYEGVAFVGICGCLFSTILIFIMIKNIFKFSFMFKFTQDVFLNSLLICSFLTLLFSFCIPFKYGYQDLVEHFGFIKQFRALGRFTWLFFYIINIVLIIQVSKVSEKINKVYFKYCLLFFVVIFTGYDAFCNIYNFQDKLKNSVPALADTENILQENQWTNVIKTSEYQAILPFPYFQVGTENLGTGINELSVSNACLVSIKTGLPMISVMGSRLPLQRAYNNLKIVYEPTGKTLDVIKDFLNDKDILIVSIDGMCSETEKNILKNSVFLYRANEFSLYKISLKNLKEYYTSYSKEKYLEYQKMKLFKNGGFFTSDSLLNYIVENYTGLNNLNGCFDKGVLKGKGKDYTIALEKCVPKSSDLTYNVSFWTKGLQNDIVSRTSLEISAKTFNNEVYTILYSNISNHCSQLDDDWALVEFNFKTKTEKDTVKVTLWNHELNENSVEIDNLLLRPFNNNVYLDEEKYLLKNNKIFYKTKE